MTAGLRGRNLQFVDGLVEAGVGVDVRAEPHAERLHERDDVLLREVARAIEGHVLDEVRQPALVVVFEHRAGLDGEAKLGASLRLPVGAHVVAQAIRQRADGDLRIDRNRLVERRGLRGGGRDGCWAASIPPASRVAISTSWTRRRGKSACERCWFMVACSQGNPPWRF